MVVKVSDQAWLVTVEDASVMNYARRSGYHQHIHGYVRWEGTGFQIYFSHVTQQSPDREARNLPPTVIPVPVSPETSVVIRACIMAEFSQVIFKPDLLSAQQLSMNPGIPAESRTEMSLVMNELQAEMESMEDGNA